MKKYSIEARRKNTNEPWSQWARSDTYEAALKQYDKVVNCGYCARIVKVKLSTEVLMESDS